MTEIHKNVTQGLASVNISPTYFCLLIEKV